MRISLTLGGATRVALVETLESRTLLNGALALKTIAPFQLGSSTAPADPMNSIVMDSAGDIFGLANNIGSTNQPGVFEVVSGSSSPTLIATFPTAGAIKNVSPIGLLIDSAGNLFGATEQGGNSAQDGSVFEIAKGSNTITTLALFSASSTGSDPQGNLIMDSSGDIFGTAINGGAHLGGTVWELPKGSGSITALASFPAEVSQGAGSGADGLVMDAAGNFFGTTTGEFFHGTFGTVWELPKNSSAIQTLATFNGTNGEVPESPLVVDAGGNIFGQTRYGGANSNGSSPPGLGTVFEVVSGSNTITSLASFGGADGQYPAGGLIADASGNLFGAASQGGNITASQSTGSGNVFEVASGTSTITPLATFNVTNGAHPNGGVLIDPSGNIFGTTSGGGSQLGGTVFELTAGGGGGGSGSGTLTPVISGKLPASTIAGQKLNATQTVTLTAGDAAVSGSVTQTLFLDTGTTVDANAIQLQTVPKTVKLKAHGHVSTAFKIASFPSTVANGTYHLVIEATDPSGNVMDAASTGTITVAPPQIDLSGAFSKTPVPGKGGKTGLTFTVSNVGNTAAVGSLAFNVETSPDGSLLDATVVIGLSKKISIKPGKSTRISAVETLPAGSYFLVVQLDPANSFGDVNPANNAFATAARITVG